MADRRALKRVVQFGKHEFSTKRPTSLRILLVKSNSLSAWGFLPNIVYREHGPIQYLVVLDYREHLRIYFFDSNGRSLGAQNFDKNDKLLRDLSKMTIQKYSLPRDRIKS